MTELVGSDPITGPNLQQADYPGLHQAASAISETGQRAHVRFIAAELCLGASAALVMDLMHPYPGARVWLGGIALFALLTVLAVQILRLRGRLTYDQDWYDGRAVAESIKTLTWRYMMRVEPFDEDMTADRNFSSKVEEVVGGNLDIRPKLAPSIPEGLKITPRMQAARIQSWEERRDLYLAARFGDQIYWYLRRSVYNGKWARIMLWLSLLSQVLAIGFVIVAMDDPELNLVPLFTTLAASAVAWSQAKRFDELRKSYREAHDQLERIRAQRALAAQDEPEFIQAVRDGEDAISREHTMWVAKSMT
jgi:conflict system pore-forming effector with SLATT domain